MSKPSDLPTWSTDTNFPAGSDPWSATSTTTEPSSGKKASGWFPAEHPPAQYLNWWQNLVYMWLIWVDAFPFEDGFAPDLRLTNDSNIILAGDGEYCHTSEILCVNPSALLSITNGAYNNSGGYYASSGAGSAVVAIQLKKGDLINSITYARFGDGVADVVVQLERWPMDMSGGPTLDINFTDTNPGAAWADNTVTPSGNPALTDVETYNLRFNYSASGLRIGNIRVDYSHPA